MPEVRDASPVVEELDHEVKFVLPAAAAAPARALLAGICRAEEPHPRGRIDTIYFDDRTLSSADEKLASDYRKSKIRLRWYDGAGTIHLEWKRRLGSRREKWRLELAVEGGRLAAEGLDGAARCGVAELLREHGCLAPGDLAPALHLTYERERFVDPASGCRLSLDTRIAAVERAPWCEALTATLDPGGETAVTIVEVKGAVRDLPPGLHALATMGARRNSYSKYTACLLAGLHSSDRGNG